MLGIKKRKFTFVNYGGAYQLRINTIEDLDYLDELDEAFWLATSAPIHQLRCDPVALEMLDYNKNGRIICREIRRTHRWLRGVLRRTAGIDQRQETLILEDINPDDSEGQGLLTAARRVLENLDKSGSEAISLADVRANEAILAKGDRNGDGIIPPNSVQDEEVQQFIKDIISTCGAKSGVEGSEGVDAELLDAFFANARAFLEWQQMYTDSARAAAHPMLPLGEQTSAAYKVYADVAVAVDGYFELCRVAAVNALLERETVQPASPADAFTSGDTRKDYIVHAPVAQPRVDAVLRFDDRLNPQYRDALQALLKDVIVPILDSDESRAHVADDEWLRVKEAFSAYAEWCDRKSGAEVESLGSDKLNRYIDGGAADQLRALIEEDIRVGKELSALRELERLILMQRWFLDICNNFISFPDLYHRDRRAMFEVGRLVIDGRIFNFNMRVQDVNRHSAIAKASGIFLLYSEITGGPDDKPFHIVTPVTSRKRGNLGLDKRGVLFGLDGKVWDVRVTKVVENPISLSEAICAPFNKISTMITSAVEKISASTEKQLQTSLTQTTASVEKGFVQSVQAPTGPPAAQPSAAEGGSSTRARDMMLIGGVAVAALGSAFAYIAKTFANMGIQKALLGVLVGVVLIMVPILIVALTKLYRRNLSGILEASGWAINARMRLTHSLARVLAPDPVRPESLTKLRKDLLKV